MREQLKERLTLEEARETGQLVDFAELRAQLLEIATAKGMPEPVRRLRHYELHSRHVPAVPALHMTPQEIAARRARERAEIEAYRKRQQEDES